jgi:enoyl-[acyl-carrier protein] reductase II
MKSNKITSLFNIKYPIIQGGMVWCSGWKLASAVSNSGGLGLIGAGSMYPDVLREHIQKCKKATDKPFGVNLPLIYPDIDKHIATIIEEGVKIVFTSAGNPKTFTSILKEHGITVVHVVSSSKFALKAQNAGVDAIVAEGFEAGGHNGREETTTFCLIPEVADAISIPLISAGGIASGRAITASLALGADAVQIGSLFASSEESSAHGNFKKRVVDATEGETLLSLKKIGPVRLLKNDFQQTVFEKENEGANSEELQNLLGKGRAKKGILEGDLINGELEIGQVASQIKEIKKVKNIMSDLLQEYEQTIKRVSGV